MSIQQALIDIAESPCGEPPPGWADLAIKFDQDAWQVAFSSGLMTATARLQQEISAPEEQSRDD